MRIPMAKLPNVKVKMASKSSNSLNAGIDFYVPEDNFKLEFNPGLSNNIIAPVHNGGLYAYNHTIDIKNGEYFNSMNFDYKKANISTLAHHNRRGPNNEMIFELYPGENVKIYSGIACEIDLGQCGLVCNRSGIASKYSCIVGAELIDCGYSNEIIFDIHNIGVMPFEFRPGDKITQLLMISYISCTPIEVQYDDLYKDMQDIKFRGLDGFGSTGHK